MGNGSALPRILQPRLDRLENVNLVLNVFPCGIVRQAFDKLTSLFFHRNSPICHYDLFHVWQHTVGDNAAG